MKKLLIFTLLGIVTLSLCMMNLSYSSATLDPNVDLTFLQEKRFSDVGAGSKVYYDHPQFETENLEHSGTTIELSNIREQNAAIAQYWNFNEIVGGTWTRTLEPHNFSSVLHHQKYDSLLRAQYTPMNNTSATRRVNVSTIRPVTGNINSTLASVLSANDGTNLRITPAGVDSGQGTIHSQINYNIGYNLFSSNTSHLYLDGEKLWIIPRVNTWDAWEWEWTPAFTPIYVHNYYGTFEVDVVFDFLGQSFETLYLAWNSQQMITVDVRDAFNTVIMSYQVNEKTVAVNVNNAASVRFRMNEYYKVQNPNDLPTTSDRSSLFIDQCVGFDSSVVVEFDLNGLLTNLQMSGFQIDAAKTTWKVRFHNIYSFSLVSNTGRLLDGFANFVNNTADWHIRLPYTWQGLDDYTQNQTLQLAINFGSPAGYFDIDFLYDDTTYNIILSSKIVNFRYSAAGITYSENVTLNFELREFGNLYYYNATFEQLAHYADAAYISTPSQLITIETEFLPGDTYQYTITLRGEFYYPRAPSLISMQINSEEVQDRGLDRGYIAFESYAASLDFSCPANIYYDVIVRSSFRYTTTLEMGSSTYLEKSMRLSPNLANPGSINLTRAIFNLESNIYEIYMNDEIFTVKDITTNIQLVTYHPFTITVILTSGQYLTPNLTATKQLTFPNTNDELVYFNETYSVSRTYRFWAISYNYQIVSAVARFTDGTNFTLNLTENYYRFIKLLTVGTTFNVTWGIRPNFRVTYSVLTYNNNNTAVQLNYYADLAVNNVTLLCELPFLFANWNSGFQTPDRVYTRSNVNFTAAPQTLVIAGDFPTPSLVSYVQYAITSNQFVEPGKAKLYSIRANVVIPDSNFLYMFTIDSDWENVRIYDTIQDYLLNNDSIIFQQWNAQKTNLKIAFDFDPINSYTVVQESNRLILTIDSKLNISNVLLLVPIESIRSYKLDVPGVYKYATEGSIDYYWTIITLNAGVNEIIYEFRTYGGAEWWTYLLLFAGMGGVVYLYYKLSPEIKKRWGKKPEGK